MRSFTLFIHYRGGLHSGHGVDDYLSSTSIDATTADGPSTRMAHSGLELVWTIIPALVFIGLGLASKNIWEEVKLNVPETDVEIRVTGKQFNWEVLYPGPDGELKPTTIIRLIMTSMSRWVSRCASFWARKM